MIRKSIYSLDAYTPGEQPAIKNIIKLNTNENPYPPSPLVVEAISKVSVSDLRLYPDPVCTEARRIAAILHGCSPDNIFFGNGSDEVLRLAIDVFVEHGGLAGGFVPGYSLYPVLAAIHESRWRAWPLPQPGTLGACADEICKERECPSLFVIINPNAPTSTAFSRAEIGEFASKYPGVVLVDEAYSDFSDSGSMADMALTHPNIFVCRTLSKSYSLAGMRVGYLVGSAEIVSAFYKVKDSYNMDRFSQAAACAALTDQNWMRANCRRIRSTRGRIALELISRGWNVPESQTNFLWAEPPSGVRAEFVMGELRKSGIIVRHFPEALTRSRLRITVGTDSQMDEFLSVLDSIASV